MTPRRVLGSPFGVGMPRWVIAILIAVCAGGCGRDYGTELKFDNIQLFYTSAVPREQAERLGKYLNEKKLFKGALVTCQLHKHEGKWQFRLVKKPDVEETPTHIRSLRQLAENLRKDVFDKDNVIVHLCDQKLRTLSVIDPDEE